MVVKRFKPTIVSGGQTGIDQTALDWAIEWDWPHGGFCPNGRIAEDGIIPEKYRLEEAMTSDYNARTLLNVIHSDATLILSALPLAEGTALTAKYAQKERKILFVLSPGFAQDDLQPIHSFLSNPSTPWSFGLGGLARERGFTGVGGFAPNAIGLFGG